MKIFWKNLNACLGFCSLDMSCSISAVFGESSTVFVYWKIISNPHSQDLVWGVD